MMHLSFLLSVIFCKYFIVEGLDKDLKYYEYLTTVDIHSRVRRSVDPHPQAALHEITFQTLGRKFHLLLKPSVPVTGSFKSTLVHADGTTDEFTIDQSKFFKGLSKSDPDSTVHLQWEDDMIIATIFTKDDMYFIEPSWRHIEGTDNQTMIAYRKSDMTWDPKDSVMGIRESFCGVNDSIRVGDEKLNDGLRLFPVYDTPYNNELRRQKRQTMSYVGTHTVCQLVVVADYYFYSNLGKYDRRATGEYIIGMVGRVNQIYKATRWPNDQSNIKDLGFEIAELIVHDSYTPVKPGELHYNMENRPNDMGVVLDAFGWEWQKFQSFCLAHLFTYQSFPGKLGLAYIASWRYTDLGGMCSPVAWKSNRKMAANTGLSTYRNPDGTRALTSQATITTAHELGHNWGCEHDPATAECAPDASKGGRYIMYPSAVAGYERNNKLFSPCSKQYIYKVVKKKGYDCFKEPIDATISGRALCGNGRKDKGEECDAGYKGDECCDNECKFIDRTVIPGQPRCSPMNFPCCKNCRIAPASAKQVCLDNVDDNFDCKKASICDGKNLTCPKADFRDDGFSCLDGGKCRKGKCENVCQQNGRQPCLCSGKDACRSCCYELNTQECRPINNTYFVQDGRPCYNGFCKAGVCEKEQSKLVQRLFSIIESLSIDKLAEFMKNNIVWTVLVLAIPPWLVAIACVEKRDKKEEEKDRPARERVRDRNNLDILPDGGESRILRAPNRFSSR